MHGLSGEPLHKYFLHLPNLVHHRPPDFGEHDQVHRFLLSYGLTQLDVTVSSGNPNNGNWILIRADGEFSGGIIQSLEKGKYLVSIQPSPARGVGKLAHKILRLFIVQYYARDVSI